MVSCKSHNQVSLLGNKATELLNEFLDFLRRYQCVAEATVCLRRLFVTPFLSFLEKHGALRHFATLHPSFIHDYVIKNSTPLTRASRKHMVSSLRSFLRFAYIRSYLERNLVEAVPIIVTRKLDRLPRGIPWKSVRKLLAAPDRSTSVGRRDYAILLLVATYGVRIGQAIHLQCRDIDWRRGIIHFPALKYGKSIHAPLYFVVAKALLRYIRKDRGSAAYPDLFLTVRGQTRPMGINHHMGTALKKYYQCAGVQTHRAGAHAIRHAFATRLMEHGIPLKTIADLLGHQTIDSTFLYTKVDVERLRCLADEWPEAVR